MVLQRQAPWNLPWTREMKDHCIQRYASALKRQMQKTKKTEEQRCALSPCNTNMCTLMTGPAPREDGESRGASRRNSRMDAADLKRAQAASQQQSNQLKTAIESSSAAAAQQQEEGASASRGGAANGAAEPAAPTAAAQDAPETQEEDAGARLPGLDKACTVGVAAKAEPNSKASEGETQEERHARHESAAAGLFRSVVQEATGNQVGC
jgi:hypothetical protein